MELPGAQATAVLGVGPNVPILNLSDEVILDILESGPLRRVDLMHLCLACKRLRRIAITRLYKNIHIDGDRCLHQLLRSILQNVSLGEMVKTLTLEWHGCTDCAVACFINRRDESEFDAKELKTLAAAAGTRALDPATVQDLAKGSNTAKAIVLFSHLPNLRILSLQPAYPVSIFDTRGNSFTNLGQFDQIWYDTGGSFELYLLLPAMLIPSLTTLIGFSASNDDNDDDDDDDDEDEHLRAGTSNVTCLFLEQSKVTGRELSRILRIFKGLRYFNFLDGGSTFNCTSCLREEFGRALACTSRTLEYLSIEWNDHPYNDNSTLGSLQGFERLRVLSVELDVLLGDDSHATVDLANVLPQTIEQLFLLRGQDGSWTEAEYLRSIKRLIRAKSGSSMPALTSIGLQSGPGLLAHLLKFAAEKGVEITSGDPRQTNLSYKTFPTPWYPLSEEILEWKKSGI